MSSEKFSIAHGGSPESHFLLQNDEAPLRPYTEALGGMSGLAVRNTFKEGKKCCPQGGADDKKGNHSQEGEVEHEKAI